jgi:hypothetical protein
MKSRNVVRIVDNCLNSYRGCGDHLALTVVAIDLRGKAQIAERSAYQIVITGFCSYGTLAVLLMFGCGHSAIDGERDELSMPRGW